MADELSEPLGPDDAKQLIRTILQMGSFRFSKHAMEEVLADDMTTVDCENVLRGGVVQALIPTERRAWRVERLG